MKLNRTDFFRKAQLVLTFALSALPLSMILLANTAQNLLYMAPVYGAALFLLGGWCILLPGRLRISAGILGAAALAAMAMVLPVGAHYALALLPALHIVLLFALLPIAGWDRTRELNPVWPTAGVLAHLLMQLLVTGAREMGQSTYDGLQGPLILSFLALGVLCLLALNRASLESASQSRRRVPLLMRRQNIALTLLFSLLGVGLAAIPAIGTLLGKAWDLVLQFIALMVGLLTALLPQGGGQGGTPAPSGDVQLGLGEAEPPSAFALFMEQVIRILAVMLLLAALVAVLVFLGKRLLRLMRLLWGRLGRYGSAASEDYEDEITDTRDEPGTDRQSLLTRLRRFAPEEKSADPVQRVRSRYRRLMRRRGWVPSSTARETLPESAARLYEQARYSGQPLSAREADEFDAQTRKF